MLHRAYGGVAGTGAMGTLGFLIAALQGGGKPDLLWLGAAISAVVLFGGIGGWLLTTEKDDSLRQSSTGDQSPNIYTHGEHSPVEVNINAAPELKLHWLDRPGGPRFSLSPGIEQNPTRLLCELYVDERTPIGNPQARWRHSSIEIDWVRLMDSPTARRGWRKYQMKGAQVVLTEPADEIAFEIQFYLDDGVHRACWIWPVRQHNDRGAWTVDGHLCSGVSQPRKADTR